jgi:hypothetical protein
MEFWIIATLGILGAASIAGGIVTLRGSTRVGFRALGAALIAAGAVMWIILLMTIPVSFTTGG